MAGFKATGLVASKYLLLAAQLSWSACGAPESQPKRTVTFRVIPDYLPPDSKILIAGNHHQLGKWFPAQVALEPQSDGSWSKTFSFEQGTHLEYKITRGSWHTEAVDSSGIELPNSVLEVESDTTVVVTVTQWRDTYEGRNVLSRQRLQNKAGHFELFDDWKYHPGDDSSWAAPQYDDSLWETVDPRLPRNRLPESGWPGTGWFRQDLTVDSSLWHIPLALHILQRGASEVYLDGKLLYTFGEVGASKDEETAYQEHNPKYVVFDKREDHVLAVRYSNHLSDDFVKAGLDPGFEVVLGDLNQYIEARTSRSRSATVYQMVFTSVPLTLGLVHLLLFLFYPASKENLYYAISMVGFATISYTVFQFPFTADPKQLLLLLRTNGVGACMAVAFGMLTTYASIFGRLPKQAFVFLVASTIFAVALWLHPLPDNRLRIAVYALFAIAALEILRAISKSGFKSMDWSWVPGSGFIAAILAFFYQILIDTQILPAIGGFDLVYVYGILILSISMSIKLSQNFAATQKNLERQLVHVKRLSQKALEEERHAKEEEIARRVLEADNFRKTQELEEARKLQLSMLPNKIPNLPELDIAVYMKTASEVGGDYYDFQVGDDGSLTVALGDATGHGMKAGTMVAAIKSLFTAFNSTLDFEAFFNKCTDTIRGMHLGNLYMALMLVKIKGQTMICSAAGMPPVLVYRGESQRVEEVVTKGMPLGGAAGFPYQTKETNLRPGDTILLMSDGFPELFNDNNEMLDYPRVANIFRESADLMPDEIVGCLCRAAEQWSNGRAQDDDITFVVLKVKNGQDASVML